MNQKQQGLGRNDKEQQVAARNSKAKRGTMNETRGTMNEERKTRNDE